jgi:hypothetical protein
MAVSTTEKTYTKARDPWSHSAISPNEYRRTESRFDSAIDPSAYAGGTYAKTASVTKTLRGQSTDADEPIASYVGLADVMRTSPAAGFNANRSH